MRGFFDPRQLIHAPATELHNGGFVPYAETPSRAATIATALPALERPADHGEAAILAVHDAGYVDFLKTAPARWAQAGRPGDVMGYIWPIARRRPLKLNRIDALAGRYSLDAATSGPQKFHTTPTPRVGGIAVAGGLAASVLAMEALAWLNPASAYGLTMLALSAIPALGGGFGEDVTRKVGVLARLMLTFASAVFASLLVGATLDRLDMPGLDTLLLWPAFAIAFTADRAASAASPLVAPM